MGTCATILEIGIVCNRHIAELGILAGDAKHI